MVLNDTITPSPTWVINTFASYSRWKEAHFAQTLGTADASTIGLSPSLFQAPILPGINAENYSAWASAFGGGLKTYIRYSNTVQMNVTKQFSKHTLKFGGNFDDKRINNNEEANGVEHGLRRFQLWYRSDLMRSQSGAVRVSRLIPDRACRETRSRRCYSGLQAAAVRPSMSTQQWACTLRCDTSRTSGG